MIPLGALVRQIQHERAIWKHKELNTDFASGMIAGLTAALNIVRALWIQTRERMTNNPHYRPAIKGNYRRIL